MNIPHVNQDIRLSIVSFCGGKVNISRANSYSKFKNCKLKGTVRSAMMETFSPYEFQPPDKSDSELIFVEPTLQRVKEFSQKTGSECVLDFVKV